MQEQGLLPTRVHAYADYLVGLVLIVAPWLFGFADDTTAGKWISVLAGVALIGMSAVTDYEGGFVKRLVPMRAHLAIDGVMGIFLVIAPWLFGFADEGANAWLPFVVIGAGEVLLAIVTDRQPSRSLADSRRASAA